MSAPFKTIVVRWWRSRTRPAQLADGSRAWSRAAPVLLGFLQLADEARGCRELRRPVVDGQKPLSVCHRSHVPRFSKNTRRVEKSGGGGTKVAYFCFPSPLPFTACVRSLSVVLRRGDDLRALAVGRRGRLRWLCCLLCKRLLCCLLCCLLCGACFVAWGRGGRGVSDKCGALDVA